MRVKMSDSLKEKKCGKEREREGKSEVESE